MMRAIDPFVSLDSGQRVKARLSAFKLLKAHEICVLSAQQDVVLMLAGTSRQEREPRFWDQ